MTAPSNTTYDASVHLSISDIAVDNSKAPAVVRVTIKASKTDPFRKGVELYLGKTGTTVCPVTAMVSYLCIRGMSSGALFLFFRRSTPHSPEIRGIAKDWTERGQCAPGPILWRAIASESGRQQRLRQKGWKIPSLRHLEGGKVLPTYNTLRSRDGSWQAILDC